MLWYDPDVRARAPTELPPSRQFANMGVVILRTGWGPGAAVASFAGGPLAGHRCARRMRAGEPRSTGNYSHAHADYNAFTLFARGEYFVVPPGYARRSSHFQNTVLVNGADLLADASLQLGMVGFRMDDKRGFSYAVSDAAAAFLPEVGVRRYRRHLLLLHRGLLVIFDDVELESSGGRMWNRFQWTVHSDPRSHHVKADGSCLRWQPHERKTPRLVLHVLEPQAFGWEHVQLESLEGEAMLAAHRLVRPEWYSDRMQVLSVLTWTEDEPAPSLLRHRRFLAAATATGPVVGFALSPLEPRQLKASDPPELADRALWLFGCDPARPDALYVVGD